MFGLKAHDRKDDERDLGFGSLVAPRSTSRLLNRNGTFNTKREGLGPLASLHLYDALLTMRWSRFLLLVATTYLFTNSVLSQAHSPKKLPPERRRPFECR